MRRSRFRPLLWMCALAAPALAGDPGLGDGHWGPLNLRYATVSLNRATPLQGASAGMVLPVASTTGFNAGDLVMVYQAQAAMALDSGTPGPLDLTATGAGRFELARIAGVDGGTALELTAPLSASFPGGGLAQVLVVPEFTSVTISAGSALTAQPWNGSSGGVIAFLSQGAVVNDGEITATGAGFRGGLSNVTQTCTGSGGFDGAPNAGKGEGVVQGRFGASFAGRGNVGNAGGGGDTCNGGGGGGGNGGEGGKGGYAAQSTNDQGGLGGAALAFLLFDERLPFGGGGGAGQSNASEGGPGGSGGGVVWFRALELDGSGVISADGLNGADAGPFNPSDGAGGGGAGGTISIHVARQVQCGLLRARGGDGGDTPELQATGGPCGTGGGGGGGRILVQAEDATGCPTSTLGGNAGIQPDPTWPVYFGATPDAGGRAPYLGTVTVVGPGLDAGLVPDAGQDAGADDGSLNECIPTQVGCGCSALGPGTLGLVAVMLALGALRKANRR
jgi:large repetitive protein